MEKSNLKNVVLFVGADAKDMSRAPRATDTAISIALAGGHVLSFDTNSLSKEVAHQAMLHGLKQKLVDSVAGKSGQEAIAAIEATASMLLDGNWTRPREGGGSSTTTLLLEAMMRVFDRTREECQTVLDGLDEQQLKELPKAPNIAAMILTIKAERAAAKAKEAAKGVKDSEADFDPFA